MRSHGGQLTPCNMDYIREMTFAELLSRQAGDKRFICAGPRMVANSGRHLESGKSTLSRNL
jgi:hypothetical protein